jgi:hypothetical protein
MKKSILFNLGYDTGYTLASWQYILVHNEDTVPCYLSWSHYGMIRDKQEAIDVFTAICLYEHKRIASQYPQGNIAIHKKKAYRKAYARGIKQGILTNYVERYQTYLYYMTLRYRAH